MPKPGLRAMASVDPRPIPPSREASVDRRSLGGGGPILLIAASLLVPALAVTATAAAHPQFDSWTTENGLPQNSINDILQTRDGYLWLATFGGLVRFDGVRFVVFDRSEEGIRSLRVRALHEDRRGTLWAATEDGMLIRYRDGRFTTYTSENGLPHATAIRIEEDAAGDLWITWVGTITRYDGERFYNFGPDHFGHPVLASRGDVYDAWWRRDAAGFHVLVAGQVRTYPIDGPLKFAEPRHVRPDKCGNVWITTTLAGLIKAGPERVAWFTAADGLPVAERDGVFLTDCHDNTWFQDSRLNVYRVTKGAPERVDLPSILAVYQDGEGSVWAGTATGGLRRMRQASIATLTARDGLPVDNVYSVFGDRAGTVWVGTWGAGVIRYSDGHFTSFGLAEGLRSLRVSSIYEDRTGRLWVGTDQGLCYLDHGRFKRYEHDGGLLQGSVWAMHEDRSGTRWFATDAGLVRSSADQLTRFTIKDGLTHDRISALFEDRAGALWIGTFQGLTRWQDGAFTRFAAHDGLVGNAVRAIHEDTEGLLWIGTYDGGLYRLAGTRLTRYTRNEGLYDNGVFQILEDGDGHLWMGSNRGISRVSRRELNDLAEGRRRSVTPMVFGVKDGLANGEVNGGRQPAGMKASDGKLWFPTMGGVAVVDPRALRTSARPPRAIVEELRVAGAPVDFAKQVRVPPGATTFEIRYTAPGFVNPELIRFRYRLAGLDPEWIDSGDRRSASFFRIPPGRYRLDVIAASHDGEWSPSGPSVDILVLAPFWQTSWFLLLALAGGSSLAIAGHVVRMRRLRRLHHLQESFSRKLIDSQESERQRISKEMHDSLGQELGLIRKVARSRHEGAGDLESAQDAFRDIGSLAERIDNQMKEIAYGLRPHQLDIIGLSKTIEGMVRRVGRASHVDFIMRIEPIDHLFPQGSHIHILRIVQEAVTNIVRHSRASHARVIVTKRASSVDITVEDEGTGFSPALPGTTDGMTHGFGLAGMRERARIVGGRVEVRSSPDAGTTVAVTLPLDAGSRE